MAFPKTAVPTLAATQAFTVLAGNDTDSPRIRLYVSRIMGTRGLSRTYGWTFSGSTKYQGATASVKDNDQTYTGSQHNGDFITGDGKNVHLAVGGKPDHIQTPTLLKRP